MVRDPVFPQAIYGANGIGLFLSTDEGRSFCQVGPPTVDRNSELDPARGLEVVAPAGAPEVRVAIYETGIVLVSRDRGGSFQAVQPASAIPSGLRASGVDRNGTMFVVSGLSIHPASTDLGASWESRKLPLDPGGEPRMVANVAAAPDAADLIYVTTQTEFVGGTQPPDVLLVSNDGGRTWGERPLPALTCLGVVRRPRALCVAPRRPRARLRLASQHRQGGHVRGDGPAPLRLHAAGLRSVGAAAALRAEPRRAAGGQ